MSNSLPKLLAVLFVFGMFLSSCDNSDPYTPDYTAVPEPFSISDAPKVETSSGLVYYNVKEGQGEFEVMLRDVVRIHYTIRRSSGRIVSSSYTNFNTRPFSATMSSTSSNTILYHQGIKEGVLGMKPGGIKVMFVPPELHSYTSSLSDDTIRVDLELVEIVL